MQTQAHSAVSPMLSPPCHLVTMIDFDLMLICLGSPGSNIGHPCILGAERGPGVGETRPPSFHGGQTNVPGEAGVVGSLGQTGSEDFDQGFDDTESAITSVSQVGRRRPGGQSGRMPLQGNR